MQDTLYSKFPHLDTCTHANTNEVVNNSRLLYALKYLYSDVKYTLYRKFPHLDTYTHAKANEVVKAQVMSTNSFGSNRRMSFSALKIMAEKLAV